MGDNIFFLERKQITDEVMKWCQEVSAPPNPFNVITALCSLGFIEKSKADEVLKQLDADSKDAK